VYCGDNPYFSNGGSAYVASWYRARAAPLSRAHGTSNGPGSVCTMLLQPDTMGACRPFTGTSRLLATCGHTVSETLGFRRYHQCQELTDRARKLPARASALGPALTLCATNRYWNIDCTAVAKHKTVLIMHGWNMRIPTDMASGRGLAVPGRSILNSLARTTLHFLTMNLVEFAPPLHFSSSPHQQHRSKF
jgi:hypothetical protein